VIREICTGIIPLQKGISEVRGPSKPEVLIRGESCPKIHDAGNKRKKENDRGQNTKRHRILPEFVQEGGNYFPDCGKIHFHKKTLNY
jgi:hypothetical protein